MKKIRIYSTEYCPYCHKTKELLTSLNLDFEDTDVGKNPDIRDELIKQTGHMTVPLIFIGDEFIGGYDALAKLHTAGELMEKIRD